jgi:prolyl-tRNA synthetase
VREALQDRFALRLDDREQMRPGWKYAEWEARGVPVRIEVGPKDVAKGQAVLVRRDNRKKEFVPVEQIGDALARIHEEMQRDLYQRALEFRTAHTRVIDDYDEFRQFMAAGEGWALSHWSGDRAVEDKVKAETKATIRNIPLANLDGGRPDEAGTCMVSGKPSPYRVVWGVAY